MWDEADNRGDQPVGRPRWLRTAVTTAAMIEVTMKTPSTTADTCAKMITKLQTLSIVQTYRRQPGCTSAPRMTLASYCRSRPGSKKAAD